MANEIVIEAVQPQQYARTVRAALRMGKSKFDLAEALALDIPPSVSGGGAGAIQTALEQAAKDIAANGGDEISWGALEGYRIAALYVLNSGPDAGDFNWREGTSYTAHLRAAKGGLDYDEFAKQQRTSREVQAMLGWKVDDSVKQDVETMTPTDKADLITALVKDNTELVEDAVQAKYREDIIDDVGGSVQGTDPIPTPTTPSTSTDGIDAIAYMKGIIAGGVPFTNTMLNRWARALSEVHGIMDDDDRNVFAGNLDDIAKLYTEAANQLRSNTWTQQ